jgi:calcineurin-like phosphoesterase family protein
MLAADNPYAVTPDTWIISDTHFYHENIGRYCSRPENWQELIIKNWNDQVAPGDTVLHLGDFALGKKTHFELLTGILNGKLFLSTWRDSDQEFISDNIRSQNKPDLFASPDSSP